MKYDLYIGQIKFATVNQQELQQFIADCKNEKLINVRIIERKGN